MVTANHQATFPEGPSSRTPDAECRRTSAAQVRGRLATAMPRSSTDGGAANRTCRLVREHLTSFTLTIKRRERGRRVYKRRAVAPPIKHTDSPHKLCTHDGATGARAASLQPPCNAISTGCRATHRTCGLVKLQCLTFGLAIRNDGMLLDAGQGKRA